LFSAKAGRHARFRAATILFRQASMAPFPIEKMRATGQVAK